MKRAWAAILSGALITLGGCAACRDRGADPVARGPTPPYTEVAAAYNARLEPLDRLWARAVTRVWYPDKEGEEQSEQVEGHFQFIRPRRLLLTFDKVGINRTFALLGSNDTRYWWMDLTGPRRAWVGTHAAVTAKRVEELGLPVHPLDLVELLGLNPVPAEGPGASIAWSEDGRHLVLTAPTEFGTGTRRVFLEPARFEPARIELRDASGNLAAESELSRFETVELPFPQTGPRIATQMLMSINAGRERMRLKLWAPENRGSRPRPAIFDLERLSASQGIEEFIDLDTASLEPTR